MLAERKTSVMAAHSGGGVDISMAASEAAAPIPHDWAIICCIQDPLFWLQSIDAQVYIQSTH